MAIGFFILKFLNSSLIRNEFYFVSGGSRIFLKGGDVALLHTSPVPAEEVKTEKEDLCSNLRRCTNFPILDAKLTVPSNERDLGVTPGKCSKSR